MDPFVTGSLISAGIGSAASLFGQQMNNDASEKAARVAGEQAIKLWKMQADYNTPANQVARLRAAGLNPNLIYGNGSASTGNMSNAPAMTDPARKSYDFSRFMDMANVLLSLKNLKAQNENLAAQTENVEAQTDQRKAQAAYYNAILDFYNKHGYFPGQASAPMSVVKEISNQPFVKRTSEAVGSAIGSVVGRLTSSVDRSPDRAVKMANSAADKAGLTGQKRADYINKFLDFYNRSH